MSDVNASPKRRRQSSLAKKVKQYFKAKEAGKEAYAKADSILNEISTSVKHGTEIQLFEKNGEPARPVRFVDLFADKNVVFKPCGVRRYDLVLVK